MMFGKGLFFAAFAAVAQVVVVSAGAAAPGCLLGAVNTAKDPSNISEVCKNNDIAKQISSKCGGDAKDALSAFADVCSKAGVKISTDVVASGTVASGTAASLTPTNSANSTSGGLSISATPTGSSPTGGAAGSGTASGKPATSTGAAGRIEVGVMAAFVGGLGVMAAAL